MFVPLSLEIMNSRVKVKINEILCTVVKELSENRSLSGTIEDFGIPFLDREVTGRRILEIFGELVYIGKIES